MQGPRLYILTAVQLVGASLAIWYVLTFPISWDAQRVAGVALLLMGLAGIATARYQLGKSFSVRAEALHLVTRGLYSKIRNPIYVFGMLAFSGMVLVLHRPKLWLLVGLVFVAQVIRARREAQVLEAAFGDEYREYRRKTWF